MKDTHTQRLTLSTRVNYYSDITCREWNKRATGTRLREYASWGIDCVYPPPPTQPRASEIFIHFSHNPSRPFHHSWHRPGDGCEARQTSKEQTKMPRFMLEGPRLWTIFFFELIHFAWVTQPKRCYWLVPLSVVNNYCVLCTVKAKKENKNIQQRTLSSFMTIPLD